MASTDASGDPERTRAQALVVGVLGGIASGKSAVARLLAAPDGVVISADALAQEVLDSPAVVARLAARHGPAVLRADGRVDRAFLARLVFDPERGAEHRKELEGWTHPAVRDRIMARLGAARASGHDPIVLDVPLLLENDSSHGLARSCDVLVFVDSPVEAREQRARRERGWQPGELARREAAQMSPEAKRTRAHHVIENHRGLSELERAVERLRQKLR
jgi:dephospho-CoA kinase